MHANLEAEIHAANFTEVQMHYISNARTMQALQDGVLTVGELSHLTEPQLVTVTGRCLREIRDGFITVAELVALNQDQLGIISDTYLCKQAIRNGVFTVGELSDFNYEQLDSILTQPCIDALEAGETSLNALAGLSIEELRDAVAEGDFPPAQHGVAMGG